MEGYKQHHATSIVLFPVRKCSPIQRALLLFALRPDSTVGALMTVVQELGPVSNLVAYSEMGWNLVGGLEYFSFFHILGIIIQID